MATPTYSINGGTQVYGVQSDWQRQAARVNDDGTIDYTPSAVNIWTMGTVLMTTYEELRAAWRSSLTSLETNDIDNRNTGKTYSTNIFFESLTDGGQVGINMVNVVCRFRLDV